VTRSTFKLHPATLQEFFGVEHAKTPIHLMIGYSRPLSADTISSHEKNLRRRFKLAGVRG
jgi:hypothetical protein